MVLKDYDEKELDNLVKQIRIGSKNMHEIRAEDEADYIRRRDQIYDFNQHIQQQGEMYQDECQNNLGREYDKINELAQLSYNENHHLRVENLILKDRIAQFEKEKSIEQRNHSFSDNNINLLQSQQMS